jgi:hypothetical protein
MGETLSVLTAADFERMLRDVALRVARHQLVMLSVAHRRSGADANSIIDGVRGARCPTRRSTPSYRRSAPPVRRVDLQPKNCVGCHEAQPGATTSMSSADRALRSQTSTRATSSKKPTSPIGADTRTASRA